jgi:hypothetical protein
MVSRWRLSTAMGWQQQVCTDKYSQEKPRKPPNSRLAERGTAHTPKSRRPQNGESEHTTGVNKKIKIYDGGNIDKDARQHQIGASWVSDLPPCPVLYLPM